MLAEVYREHSARVVATLARLSGDIDLAEDCFQDAVEKAIGRWPIDGEPDNPAAWLTTVARNSLIDRLRREQRGREKLELMAAELGSLDAPESPRSVFSDDRLELLFACCHPALSPEARVALTLRALGGLTTPEIARAFLVPEATMAQRLVRAKRKIKLAGIPFALPPTELLSERIEGVLTVLYLIFNEGYASSAGEVYVRADLCTEAISLARVLLDLLPDEAEVAGLLALLLMHDSRRAARTGVAGDVIVLDEQDRTKWDDAQISQARTLLIATLSKGRPGPYQVQAAISAIHSEAPSAEQTDWAEIAALYEVLIRMSPTPVVRLNSAVAVGMATSIETGLSLIEELRDDLHNYPPFEAARADLLRRSGRYDEAVTAYGRAIDANQNASERAYLRRRAEECRRYAGDSDSSEGG